MFSHDRPINTKRRHFLQIAGIGAASLAASNLLSIGAAEAATTPAKPAAALAPIKQIRTGVLDIGYYEAGPKTGPVVLLLHGYPYSIQSFEEVAPILAARGFRVIVPHLRGHGTTRFIDQATPRAGQQGATLARTAVNFNNPDYVDVVIHSYRHRLGLADGYPAYVEIEKRLVALPPITQPAITLDGITDGNYPAGDGSSTAKRFTGKRIHRQVPNAGHNLPQEAPQAFADAVIDVAAITQ